MSGYRRPTVCVNGVRRLVSRVTMERELGRPLRSDEIVHHRNGDPFDNRVDNLQIVSRAEHKRIHAEIGLATRFQSPTHCSRGHEFSPENTRVRPTGGRACRKCSVIHIMAYRARKRLAPPVATPQRPTHATGVDKMTTKPSQCRQGDVFLRPIQAIPADAKPVKRDGGRVILAYGEVTGHAHAITDSGVGLLEHAGKRYLSAPEGGTVRHEEHSAIRVVPGVYEVVIQREYAGEDEFRQVAD